MCVHSSLGQGLPYSELGTSHGLPEVTGGDWKQGSCYMLSNYFRPGAPSVSQTPVLSQWQVLCGQIQFGNLFFREFRLVVPSSGSPGPRCIVFPGILGLEAFLHRRASTPSIRFMTCLSSPPCTAPSHPCSGFIQAFCFLTAILSPTGAREVREGVQESQCRGGSAEPCEGAAGNAEQVSQAGTGSAGPGGPAGTLL